MLGQRKGFTLIELLVVIAIIAILAALLFPLFVHAKVSAKRAACMGSLKQLGTATRLYMDDYNGKYPGRGSYPTSNNDAWYAYWLVELYKYVKSDRVYQCPDAVHQWPIDETMPEGYTKHFLSSYSFSEYLFFQGNGVGLYNFATESRVRSPQNTAMMADGYEHLLFHDWNDTGQMNDLESCPSGMNRIKYANGPGPGNDWNHPIVRHVGPGVLFCDMHVRMVDKDKFRAYNYPGISNPTTCREYPVIYPGAQSF